MWELQNLKTDEEWREIYEKDMEESREIEEQFNQEMFYHLKRYYNWGWQLDIDWFFERANEVLKKIFEQSWENREFWTIETFKGYLIKWVKLYILKYNLDYEISKKLWKSMLRFPLMYWEIIEFWEEITESVKKYQKENRNNEQKKEEIKELIEKDYEIFFWEWKNENILDTKVWKAKNDIIEVFSRWYYYVNSNWKPEE